jgi:hypothetical protein
LTFHFSALEEFVMPIDTDQLRGVRVEIVRREDFFSLETRAKYAAAGSRPPPHARDGEVVTFYADNLLVAVTTNGNRAEIERLE